MPGFLAALTLVILAGMVVTRVSLMARAGAVILLLSVRSFGRGCSIGRCGAKRNS